MYDALTLEIGVTQEQLLDYKGYLQHQSVEYAKNAKEHKRVKTLNDVLFSMLTQLISEMFRLLNEQGDNNGCQQQLGSLTAQYFELAKTYQDIVNNSVPVAAFNSLVMQFFEAEQSRDVSRDDMLAVLVSELFQAHLVGQESYYGKMCETAVSSLVMTIFNQQLDLGAEMEQLRDVNASLVLSMFDLVYRLEQMNPVYANVISQLTLELFNCQLKEADNTQSLNQIISQLVLSLFQAHHELEALRNNSMPMAVVSRLVMDIYDLSLANQHAGGVFTPEIVISLITSLFDAEIRANAAPDFYKHVLTQIVSDMFQWQLESGHGIGNDEVVSQLVLAVFDQALRVAGAQDIFNIISAMYDDVWGNEPIKIKFIDEDEIIRKYENQILRGERKFPVPTASPPAPAWSSALPLSSPLPRDLSATRSDIRRELQVLKERISRARTTTPASAKVDFSGPELVNSTLKEDEARVKKMEKLLAQIDAAEVQGLQNDVATMRRIQDRYNKYVKNYQKTAEEVRSLSEETALIDQIPQLERDQTTQATNLSMLEAQLAQDRNTLAALTKEMAILNPKGRVAELKRDIAYKQQRISSQQRKRIEIQKKIDVANSSKDDLAEITRLEEEQRLANEKLKDLDKQLEPLRNELSNLKKDVPPTTSLSIVKQQAKLKETEVLDKQRELARINKEIANAEKKTKKIDEEKDEVKRLGTEITQRKERISELDKEITEKQTAMKKALDEVVANETKYAKEASDNKTEANRLKREFEDKVKKIADIQKKINNATREALDKTPLVDVDLKTGESMKIPTLTEKKIEAYMSKTRELNDEIATLSQQLEGIRNRNIQAIGTESETATLKAEETYWKRMFDDAKKRRTSLKTEKARLEAEEVEAARKGGSTLENLKKQTSDERQEATRLQTENTQLEEDIRALEEAKVVTENLRDDDKRSESAELAAMQRKKKDLLADKTRKKTRLEILRVELKDLLDFLNVDKLESPLGDITKVRISEFIGETRKKSDEELVELRRENEKLKENIKTLDGEIKALEIAQRQLREAREDAAEQKRIEEAVNRALRTEQMRLRRRERTMRARAIASEPDVSQIASEPDVFQPTDEEEMEHLYLMREQEWLRRQEIAEEIERTEEIERETERESQETEREVFEEVATETNIPVVQATSVETGRVFPLEAVVIGQELPEVGIPVETGRVIREFGFSRLEHAGPFLQGDNPFPTVSMPPSHDASLEDVAKKLARIKHIFDRGFPVLSKFMQNIFANMRQMQETWGDVPVENIDKLEANWSKPNIDVTEIMEKYFAYTRQFITPEPRSAIERYLRGIENALNNREMPSWAVDDGKSANDYAMMQIATMLVYRHVISPQSVEDKWYDKRIILDWFGSDAVAHFMVIIQGTDIKTVVSQVTHLNPYVNDLLCALSNPRHYDYLLNYGKTIDGVVNMVFSIDDGLLIRSGEARGFFEILRMVNSETRSHILYIFGYMYALVGHVDDNAILLAADIIGSLRHAPDRSVMNILREHAKNTEEASLFLDHVQSLRVLECTDTYSTSLMQNLLGPPSQSPPQSTPLPESTPSPPPPESTPPQQETLTEPLSTKRHRSPVLTKLIEKLRGEAMDITASRLLNYLEIKDESVLQTAIRDVFKLTPETDSSVVYAKLIDAVDLKNREIYGTINKVIEPE